MESQTGGAKVTGKRHTNRHYEVLAAIRTYRNDHGFSPSIRNLSEMTGITAYSQVLYYLKLLENEGLIRRTSNISRSIELTAFGKKYRSAVGQRKWVSPETIEKKRQGAIKDCPKNAFVPRPKKKADADHSQECFERAVALALQNDAKKENAQDVVRHNRRPLLLSQAKAVKVG